MSEQNYIEETDRRARTPLYTNIPANPSNTNSNKRNVSNLEYKLAGVGTIIILTGLIGYGIYEIVRHYFLE